MSNLTLYDITGASCLLPVQRGENLMQAVYLSGYCEPPPLCAGIGKCGRCRLKILPSDIILPAQAEDLEILGPELCTQGWRLGCKHEAQAGLLIELPAEHRLVQPASSLQPILPTPGTILAVDFGSTSIHYQIVLHPEAHAFKPANNFGADSQQEQSNLLEGSNQAAASSLVNPQIGAGSDIMSRLQLASTPQGQKQLQQLSLNCLQRMCSLSGAEEICLAANPAMVYLILGLESTGLARAPYYLDYHGGCIEKIQGLPPVWVAPLISPFIGGDTSAGYAALALCPENKINYPFLLADLGTNGEFLLALDKKNALAASLPLGPALEGIGMRCGAEARSGVITGFQLTPAGLKAEILGQGTPESAIGISGTGYLALFHLLRRTGLLNTIGHFTPTTAMPLAKKLLPALRPDQYGIQAFHITPRLFASAKDIEEILKIKSAFALGITMLLEAAGLRPGELEHIYIAGALGQHVGADSLEELGFIPSGTGNLVRLAGNTSLQGAMLMARHPELRQKLIQWATQVKTLNLAEEQSFQKRFAEGMHF